MIENIRFAGLEIRGPHAREIENTADYFLRLSGIEHPTIPEQQRAVRRALNDVTSTYDELQGLDRNTQRHTTPKIHDSHDEDRSPQMADLYLKHHRLVRWTVDGLRSTTYARGIEYADVVQAGFEGLINAYDRFIPGRSAAFSTYAYPGIRNFARRELNKYSPVILPSHVTGMQRRINEVNASRQSQGGRQLAYSEISKLLDIPMRGCDNRIGVDHLMRATLLTRHLGSIDTGFSTPQEDFTPPGNSYDAPMSSMTDNNDSTGTEEVALTNVLFEERTKLINDALNVLDLRSADIIKRRFGIDYEKPMTLEAVGKIYNFTRERVRQIESKAIAKMRNSQAARALKDYENEQDSEEITSRSARGVIQASSAEENWRRAYASYRNGAISLEEAKQYAEEAVASRAASQTPASHDQIRANIEAMKQRDLFTNELWSFLRWGCNDRPETYTFGQFIMPAQSALATIIEAAYEITDQTYNYPLLRETLSNIRNIDDDNLIYTLANSISATRLGRPVLRYGMPTDRRKKAIQDYKDIETEHKRILQEVATKIRTSRIRIP